MIRHLFGRIRNDLIRQLFPCSKELEEISASFTERVKNLDIISFYEEYAMPPFKTQVSCISFIHHWSKARLDVNSFINYFLIDCAAKFC
jgi:hypothetical protein